MDEEESSPFWGQVKTENNKRVPNFKMMYVFVNQSTCYKVLYALVL